ncbi:MAG: hypothetical protein JWL77_4125 [Chthonomonadaceae bacterium]|nr:hypothetical protein [Chthonomonadaceae bacterium]
MHFILYKPRRQVHKKMGRAFLALIALFCIAAQTGCSRSLQADATKIAKAGTVTANQMADYYESLAQADIDSWELESFQIGLLGATPLPADATPPTPAEVALALNERRQQVKAIGDTYKKEYDYLIARARLARQVGKVYSSFARLANYDTTEEVSKSLDTLKSQVEDLRGKPLNLGQSIGSLPITPENILNDIVKELTVVQQNRAYLREAKRLISTLEKLKQLFDAETPAYNLIAQRRTTNYRGIAISLVRRKSVVSREILSRFLDTFQLKWPEPPETFTDAQMIEGVVGLINARATPLATISENTADALSASLDDLISLHKNLQARRAVSLTEIAQQSETVQALLEALNKASKNTLIPVLNKLDR